MTSEAHDTPGPTPFSRRLLATTLAVAVVVLIWRMSDLLVLAFGGVVLAVALRALANTLEDGLRVPRRWSLLAALLLIGLALGAVAWVVGDPLAEQLSRLRERLPAATEAVMKWVHGHRLGQFGLQIWQDATADGPPLSRLAGVATLTLGLLGNLALILIMAVYLAAGPDIYRKGLVRLLPVAWRTEVDEALKESAAALRRWLLGQSISMLFVGVTTTLGLWSLGIALPLAVGLISGLLAFIPFFGALAGALLAVVLAFIEGPQPALYVALLCVAIQQVEGHVLSPLVQKWAVELPPVLAIVAAVVFGALFGLVGVLFATPMMVVALTLIRRLYVEEFLERGGR
jgi:predicted PurR-regulated permease PerM